MAVDSVSVNLPQSTSIGTAYDRNSVSAASNELTMTDFYQLLAAQLKYQDADNPMDTSQMMVQMVQTESELRNNQKALFKISLGKRKLLSN